MQLIALALGFGFLREYAAIEAFEPAQDLVWKLLLSVAFVYMATRVPSMLGNAGTFDSWVSTLYFGLNLPGTLMRSAKTIGLLSGGMGGGPAAAAVGAVAATAAGTGAGAAASGLRSAAEAASSGGGATGAGSAPGAAASEPTYSGRRDFNTYTKRADV